MITRSNPDVDYIADEIFQTYGFTQNIRAGNTLYLSGVAPFKGNLEQVEVVGVGDIRAQVATPWRSSNAVWPPRERRSKTGSPKPSIPRI